MRERAIAACVTSIGAMTIPSGLDKQTGLSSRCRPYRHPASSRAEGTRLALTAFASMGDLGLLFDQGFAAILFATVLDPAAPDVGSAIQLGRGQLIALGARPFLDQLDAAVARRAAVRPEQGVAAR